LREFPRHLTFELKRGRDRWSLQAQITSFKSAAARMRTGMAMAEALQVNFALWGMIICAAIKISQLLPAL
jgi:hypothetical protein